MGISGLIKDHVSTNLNRLHMLAVFESIRSNRGRKDKWLEHQLRRRLQPRRLQRRRRRLRRLRPRPAPRRLRRRQRLPKHLRSGVLRLRRQRQRKRLPRKPQRRRRQLKSDVDQPAFLAGHRDKGWTNSVMAMSSAELRAGDGLNESLRSIFCNCEGRRPVMV
jgi:hypothetical protein